MDVTTANARERLNPSGESLSMSLIELWQRPPKSIPQPSYVNRIKDDPDEPLTTKERKALHWREWYERSKKRQETTADGLEAWYVSQKLKDEYAANDYEGAW